MGKMFLPLSSSKVITRFKNGEPVLSSKDIPYEADCIFNAGVTKYKGKYVTLFRKDYGFDGNNHFNGCVVGVAFSDDGVKEEFMEKTKEMNESIAMHTAFDEYLPE